MPLTPEANRRAGLQKQLDDHRTKAAEIEKQLA